jgi:hypothetical protein
MKRRYQAWALALAVLGMAGTAWAMTRMYSSGASGLAITQANRNTVFVRNITGGNGAAFGALYVSVRSRSTSANTCAFSLGAGVAAVGDIQIAPGASFDLTYDTSQDRNGWAAIGAICATGQTATFDVVAGR